ncbi:hypothetical protein [endosymbiont GvMRE of Glomus versiforme]|uniref:hypothetical protein n=1 Tax=endosymbiont GvMRE of Glomus versiforme TaxID=2039283 RepID=UPI0011C3CB87|nr:hypothetical protein [endosymbiont GvMRE of Glomus versiforme]
MLQYFYPQWLGKTRYPKYTMNFFLWVPLIIFFICRFFYFRKFYFSTKKDFAFSFIKWTLSSYIFLTIGFLYFPFHNIDKFPSGRRYWLREISPKIYDSISYNRVPWLTYALFLLYFLCKWQAGKYRKKAILQSQSGEINMVNIEKDLTKIKLVGTGFFCLWFWLLYCNTCVGWYFPFGWQ